ncbi:MAG: DUF1501 domain-containing protein [Verrucomicrobiota bacterium]
MSTIFRKTPLSRRAFLGQASCAAVSATPILSTLLNLRMAGNAVAATPAPDDYKALVCFFFAGGNDSFNTLIPRGATEYAEYATTRNNLAIPQADLLQINGSQGGKQFGLNPAMPELQAVYNADPSNLAFICNVGTLIEPTTITGFNNGTNQRPLALFSHIDAATHWQTSVPDQRGALGWGGRVADLLSSHNMGANVSMNISLSGSNTFQSGANTVSYEIDSSGNGSILLDPYTNGNDPTIRALSSAAINSLMDVEYTNLFQKAFAEKNRSSIDASAEFNDAISQQTIDTPFTANGISQSFQMVAKTIAARELLNMKRQIFFIRFGGFDHHDELIESQAGLLTIVSKAMSEFNSAMTELDLSDKVTTFTASDFARTLTSNGKGTDHAWGSNQMVMGGAVRGGQFFGTYPNLDLGNNLDVGRGRLIPTMSTDEYYAELALWFGVPKTDLDLIFPNLYRFYSTSSIAPPVGFMTI